MATTVTSTFDWTNPTKTDIAKVNSALKTPWNEVDPKTLTAAGLGLNGYKWNLPPHLWSLPVEASSDPIVNNPTYIGANTKYRRGRIYWYARVDNTYVNSASYNYGIKDDPRYGFHFMWNPTELGTSVATNMSVTPSFADKFADVVGAFPSGQALSLSLVLDRTNDFACFKSMGLDSAAMSFLSSNLQGGAKGHYDPLSTVGASNPNKTTTKNNIQLVGQLANFYSPGSSFDYGFAETLASKVDELMKLGTIADIEYIYKAINGPGWKNVATGRETSEIGFLRPTLLRIDLGPLSYLGYVSAMSVNHVKFTKAMIPMTTTVDIQFNLMATAGLVTK